MLNIQIKKGIIFILIFTSYKGLGLFSGGGLGRGEFNLLSVLQIITTLLLFLFFLRAIKNKNKYSGSLFKIFLVLIAYLFFEFVLSLILLVFSGGVPVMSSFYNFTKIFYVLAFFSTITLIDSKKELTIIYNFIITTAIVSAIIAIIAFFFPGFGLFMQQQSIKIGSEFRFYIPTSSVIVSGYFFLLAKNIKQSFRSIDVFLLLLLFLVTIMQLNRSTIILLVVFTALAFIFNGKLKIIPYLVVFILLAYFISNIFLERVGLSFKEIGYIIDYSFNGVKNYNSNNTFIWRLEVLLNNLNFVTLKGHIFGIGFNWRAYSFVDYANNHFVLSPTNDNAFANIIIVLGLPGMVIYYSLIKKSFSSLNNKKNKIYKTDFVNMGLKYSLLYLLSISFFTNGILIGSNSLMIYILIGLIYSYALFGQRKPSLP